jgi:hypothetical protein
MVEARSRLNEGLGIRGLVFLRSGASRGAHGKLTRGDSRDGVQGY